MTFSSILDKLHRKKYEKTAQKVLELERHYAALSDEELVQKTQHFKNELANGKTIEDIKIEASATVREAAYRILGMRHYFVQIIGGLVLLDGDVAEMSTGEGKTLVATLPSYIRALEGKGVHVITSNDYLAARDKELMGKVHEFLGLTVGLNIQGLQTHEKQQAYEADITYGVGNEFGFDYLRDHLIYDTNQKVQRPLHFAIIDEVDSILIDEARTPLIIAGKNTTPKEMYGLCDNIVKSLKKDKDYVVDLEYKAVSFTDDGIDKIQRMVGIKNLYDLEHRKVNHHLINALKANVILHKNVDYIVENDEIKLVDMNTGRVMEGRSLSEGLHQALEAKENVTLTDENTTQSTITLQNYFRKYNMLSGMTGTAKTEEVEFRKLYNMMVVQIPTNKPKIRKDKEDLIFETKEEKYLAITEEVQRQFKTGRPILIGTTSIEQSLEIAEYLDNKTDIAFQVLNAKTVEFESELIATAGERHSVMIATNMAGRGTDIILEPISRELGGLAVICAERNESRRVDNQLIGRAGRQGDPGESQFFISLEDDLFIRHAGEDVMKKVKKKLKKNRYGLIINKQPYKLVKNLQLISEGRQYSSREYTTKLDDVLNDQRDVIYNIREQVLEGDNLLELSIKYLKEYIEVAVAEFCPPEIDAREWDLCGLKEELKSVFYDILIDFPVAVQNEKEIFTIMQNLVGLYEKSLHDKNQNDILQKLLQQQMLLQIDKIWIGHIETMSALKDGSGLRSFAQEDPLRAYQLEGYEVFNKTMNSLKANIAKCLATVSSRIEIEGDSITVIGF